MADQRKRISELPASSSLDNLYTIGVDANNDSVKVPFGQIVTDALAETEEAKTAAQNASTQASDAMDKATEVEQKADDNADEIDSLKSSVSGIRGDVTTLQGMNAINQAFAEEASAIAKAHGVVRFNGFQETEVVVQATSIAQPEEILFYAPYNVFIARKGFTFHNSWPEMTQFNDLASNKVYPNKVYILGNKLYMWSDTENTLVMAGADPEAISTQIDEAIGDAKQEINSSLSPRLFINANKLLDTHNPTTLPAVCALINAHHQEYTIPGVVVTFMGADGWETWQWLGNGDFSNPATWKKFGGSASVGNCYNVTVDEPLAQGYYDLPGAIAVAYRKGYTTIGIQITFSIADKSWKTYQYIGADKTETNFKKVENWVDLAGMSAGDEVLINVDHLCGVCSNAAFYTLEYAIAAVQAISITTGINYAKSGLILTYKVADNQWETKQFKGDITDFGEVSLWSDFGGGGSRVETSDTPQANGEDALSTGGAYRYIPTQVILDTETPGVVKISLANEAGEQIGEEKQFAVGTGMGGGSGTIVTMTPKYSPLYAKAGGSVILEASVRSITMQGSSEQSNIIERVELYDRDTNTLLETYRLNQGSSADTTSYDFLFDLSAYFQQASSRKFKFVVYDDSNNSGSRNINVTAVDVTIKSEQTLNYTANTVLNVGGATKNLPMYRFANNASESGILCTTEIFVGGQWKQLGQAVISDTYSHSISINPNNCAGSVLTHGAYPLRIHGEDIASGVVGNYLHTTVMVVDPSSYTPLIATRWYSEQVEAQLKQYETINMDFAVYSPTATNVQASIIETIAGNETTKQTTLCQRAKTYTYIQRVDGVSTDGSATIGIKVQAAAVNSQTATFRVLGTLLNIESVTSQLMLDMDMANRSNSDADKSITDNGYSLQVTGANYSTNGFIKDSFGTDEYGTENDGGVMALRIAENVTASLDYTPFNQAAVETNGMAIQFRIRTKHIADDDARLISCIANGYGFYVTGKEVVFTTDNNLTVEYSIVAALKDDSLTDVAIVIEPISQAPYSGIGMVKMYFDGELIGCCYYDRGSLGRHATPITFDGSHGDLCLYNIRAWETYYSFEQSFNNYLLKMTNAEAMITEYHYNDVMASQSAEGKPATNRPQAAALYEKGLAYFVLCKSTTTDDNSINYPPHLESLTGDKKTAFAFDLYFYDPNRPWQDFVAIGVPTTNQGTTSSMRPIKNIKMKLSKCSSIRLLHSRDEFLSDPVALAKYDECAANIANKKVQVLDTSLPTNIITVKVDYSESGGANNGASTQLFNELQIALGANYMTPAQNAYFANGGRYILNTSIDSIPVAFFRTDANSPDATSPAYGYFHAKGNWNFDKGDPKVFGFEGVEGYNKNCLNYGDFYELIAARGQSLDAFYASLNTSDWNNLYMDEGRTRPVTIVVLSEFCGANHRIFRKQENGTWSETTGTMTYSGGRWRISGDVVNPVENYELKAYDALDWFQGVNSVDDMLVLDGKGKPIWLTYFESRYPDDDTLNAAYEDGRKVPYYLFKWLEWCQQCNHNLDASDGNITIDGVSVSGTKANRLKKFKRELHKIANVYSMGCYHIFTDYILAVDQRSKNMMVGFYLDTDGVVRMYLNHLYDGDTILGSDNDCGLTIPAELDPNNDPQGYYQGHDSVLFVNLAAADYIWLKDYTSEDDINDTTKTITLHSIAERMRSVELSSGLRPFSPQGIEKYWVKDRLSKWPKLVSSYDGIRKYIEHSLSNDNYFYALHGLSIQRLEELVNTRFRYRDGYYQVGDTFKSAASMRCTGTNMSITIKAAKDGFFGLGVDRANEARESRYLQEGESATFHSGNTNLGSGVMLYLFGADRVAELDIRNATPKQSGWDISDMTLLRKLTIGGQGFSPATSNGDELSTLNLGQMPFLEEIDARNFPLTSIDATYCPRLKKVQATGSRLTKFTPAQTSPLETLSLPATMVDLLLVNLPELTYPSVQQGKGLTIAGVSNIQRFQVSGCPKIDALSLMEAVVDGSSRLTEIGMDEIDIEADTTILDKLMSLHVRGISSQSDEDICDGLSGRWLLPTLIEDEALNALNAYFEGLTIHNAQFTIVMFDDTNNSAQNITNLDNNTTGDAYVASGHILRIYDKLIPVKGKLNTATGKWVGQRISETNYRQLPDGSDWDYRDSLGNIVDTMMRFPGCWYKGINDFKNQKKYICWSSVDNEPISTARNIRRSVLSNILYQASAVVTTTSATINVSTLQSEGVITSTNNYNVYSFDVEGMKQVRFPGMNNANIGAVFLNREGVIISTFNMAVSNSMFDFVEGDDYVFCDVPEGAKMLVFTAPAKANTLEAIAVDSTNIEAIEPDWVYNEPWLGGVYQGSVDGLTNYRSISGGSVRVGTGTQVTSTEWTYDADGEPRNTPLGSMNYTYKDLQNIAHRRGRGFQCFDYEMSKICAILWFSLHGTRDAQKVCGYGKGAGGSTGDFDLIGKADSQRTSSNNGNKCLGFESFFGCTWEIMDNIAVNIPDYATFLRDRSVATSTYPIDAKYHIFNPITRTERVVQGINASGYCIGRVKHGRYCDVIASKLTSDNSSWAMNYCDVNYYTHDRGRLVGRSSNNAGAHGGLVYANAYYASSNSNTNNGSRLAFRGEIVIEDK